MVHKPVFAGLLVCLAFTGGCRNERTDVGATWGLDVIDREVQNKRNVVLPPDRFDLTGFIHDVSEYRVRSVRRVKPQAKIAATVASAGSFYPGVVLYDSTGDERFSLSIDGKQRGIIAANADDNRQYLYFLEEPVAFRGGERLELAALTDTGNYRVENMVLLAEKPAAKQHLYEFSQVSADPGLEPGRVVITWITNWPAACKVEWRGATSGTSAEQTPFNNHRLLLADLRPGAAYEYRISGRTREGNQAATPWTPFRTDPHSAPAGTAATAQVRLSVGYPGETPRPAPAGFPVTSGIPFPKGALGSPDRTLLRDAAGREVPLQTETLARWDDGSIKWLLLDAQSLAAPAPYTVEYGAAVRRGAVSRAVSVTENADAVTVDTGRLRFTASKKGGGLLQSLSIDGEPLLTPERPAAFQLTAADGTVYTTLGAPDEIAVESRGPLRAVVRLSGRHADTTGRKLFAWALRIHAFAGQPYLRLQHTFANDGTDDNFRTIKSLTLRLPLGDGTRHVQWKLDDTAGDLTGAETAALKQHTDNRYSLSAPRHPESTGKRARGYAEWSDGAHSVALAVRDFWQNYPKDLDVSGAGIEVGICPELRSNEYNTATGTVDEHRLFYYLQDGLYKLHEGISKTHDLWLEFAKGPHTSSALRTFREPLLATAPAEWYAASMALGEVAVPKPKGILAAYDNAFARSFAEFLQNRETNREYGMLNFGDWWGERIINWGNSEYDTPHSFLLQYMRTGKLDYFRTGEQSEWHTRDVDTVHYHRDSQVAGRVWAHAIGHTGDYYNERPRAGAPPEGFREGSPHSHMAADHTFVEGHFDYYFLTGDRRSLETARHVVDSYDSYFTRNYDFNNCRQPGWHLIMSMAAYNATYDKFYLNAARIIVERVLERQTPDGGWQRELVPGHCYCTPRHRGNAGFMVGVLLTGMKYYYAATADERVADSIVKGAHFLVNSMWVPEAKGFHYTSCPKSVVGPTYNFRLFDALVFAHRRTGDAQLRQVLVDGTAPAMDAMHGSGKQFTQHTRVTPHFINHLVKLVEQPTRE